MLFNWIYFGIVFDKSNQKDEIKITLYSPEVENFIIYEQPFVSQQEYTNSLTEFFVSNNEWEDKNALDFKEDEYENNITSEKISKNNFKLNKIYSHKVKLSYVIDKKKYNYENILKFLKDYIQIANERIAENFSYKRSIILKNKIAIFKEAYDIALINNIDKPLNKDIYLFSDPDRSPPLIFKGYEVLSAEIKHMEKRNSNVSK